MTTARMQLVGSLTLSLSLLTFAIFFINVLIGGPMRQEPWMSDVGEMLTLFVAVVLFVCGTIAREAQAQAESLERRTNGVDMKNGS